jgi:hypothetical protein
MFTALYRCLHAWMDSDVATAAAAAAAHMSMSDAVRVM